MWKRFEGALRRISSQSVYVVCHVYQGPKVEPANQAAVKSAIKREREYSAAECRPRHTYLFEFVMDVIIVLYIFRELD